MIVQWENIIQLKLNNMKLELNEQELDYLTRIVEEHCGEFFEDDTEEYKEMVRDLYSKLIVLTKTK